MEHGSPEALKKYLHDHPNADPKNHTVSKGDGGGDADKAKSDKSDKAKSFQSKAKSSWAHSATINDKVKKQVDRLEKLVSGYKTADPKKAKEVAEKMESDAKSSLSNLEVSLNHSESAHNLSGKDKKALEEAKKAVSELKKTVDKGISINGKPDMHTANSLVNQLFDAAEAVRQLQ
jgi:hypothetical protein